MKKRTYYSVLVLIPVMIAACSGNRPFQTKTENLWDIFTIDIPTNMYFDTSSKNKTAIFNTTDRNAHLFVYLKDSVSVDDINRMVAADKQWLRSHNYNILDNVSSDSIVSFKYSQGFVMGKTHYVVKDIDKCIHFIVKYDGLEGRDLNDIIEVANSIKLDSDSNFCASKLMLTYDNNYYSVKYPICWQPFDHPDQMSDVYIGSNQEQFGVIIVRFYQAASLQDIKSEMMNNQRQLGLSVSSAQTKIADKSGYKITSTGTINSQRVKFIEYIFKNDNMFYDLKFGGDAKVANNYNQEMQNILNSFTLK